MKTLANCSPLEFLTQTSKIRKSVESWLALTQVMEIRRRMPEISPEMTEAEKAAALRDQIRRNLSDMVGAAIEDHPQETAELLCLLCFIDPAEMDSHTMPELLGGLSELLNNEEVLGFFVSLARLGLTSGSATRRE